MYKRTNILTIYVSTFKICTVPSKDFMGESDGAGEGGFKITVFLKLKLKFVERLRLSILGTVHSGAT